MTTGGSFHLRRKKRLLLVVDQIHEHFSLVRSKLPVFSDGQRSEMNVEYPDALELDDAVAEILAHPSYLPVQALV